MLRCVVLGLVGLAAGAAWAQLAPSPEGTPAASASPASAEPTKADISIEEPRPGDHWTVEVRDEITGAVSTQTNVITEVTLTDISVRFNIVRADKTNNDGFGIYDRSWNLMRAGSWQHFLYDGSTGIRAPLTVGKTWTFQSKAVNAGNNLTWNRSGTSTVADQETVTTKAGTDRNHRFGQRLQRANQDRGSDSPDLVRASYRPLGQTFLDHSDRRSSSH